MLVLLRIVAGSLLIAHGLVHLLYLAEDVDEFRLDGSWVVPHDAARPIGMTLMVATIVASGMLGLAVWGLPWLAGIWPLLMLVAAVSSLVLLFAFWNNRLAFGITIDIALIALVVLRPDWIQQIG